METIKDTAKTHPFFKDFSTEQLDKILHYAKQETFDSREYIFKEGQEAERFYLLEKGIVNLEIHIPNYGAVIIEKLTTGNVLGWSWFYPPHRWHLDARATEPVQTIIMDGKALRENIKQDHELGYHMMERISTIVEDRLQATRCKLIEFYKVFPAPDKSRQEWEKLL